MLQNVWYSFTVFAAQCSEDRPVVLVPRPTTVAGIREVQVNLSEPSRRRYLLGKITGYIARDNPPVGGSDQATHGNHGSSAVVGRAVHVQVELLTLERSSYSQIECMSSPSNRAKLDYTCLVP